MNKLKRAISLLVTLCLSVTLVAGTAFADPGKNNGSKNAGQMKAKVKFNDVNTHWARQNISLMCAMGLTKGYGDGSFKPNNYVNKEEAITMIVRMLNKEDKTDSKYLNRYKWNKGRYSPWAQSNLSVAVDEEIITEMEMNSLAFNKPAMRYEVAKWLVRAMGWENEAQGAMNKNLQFDDKNTIPDEARGYVYIAVQENLIEGYDDDTFKPGKFVTRAEMVTMLANAEKNNNLPSPKEGVMFAQGVIKDIDEDNDEITISQTALYFSSLVRDITVKVVGDTDIYLDGKEADLGDLDKQDRVYALLDSDSDKEAIIVIARSYNVNDEDEDESTVEGKYISFETDSDDDPETIEVSVEGNTKAYYLASDVEVKLDGIEDVGLDKLLLGYEVELTIEDGEVTKIEADSNFEIYEVSGRLTEKVEEDDNSIEVRVNNKDKVYKLADVVVILDRDGDTSDYLEEGTYVELTLRESNNEVVKIKVD